MRELSLHIVEGEELAYLRQVIVYSRVGEYTGKKDNSIHVKK